MSIPWSFFPTEELETLADHAIFFRDGKLILDCDLEELRSESGESMAERYRALYARKEAV